MKYKLIQKGKPGDRQAPKKWYAAPVKSGMVTQKSLAKTISGRSSLTMGDIANTLQNLGEILPEELIKGNSVQIDGLGNFRISFSSEGVDEEKDFTVDKIKGMKVIFTPSTDFKKAISNIKFEIEK